MSDTNTTGLTVGGLPLDSLQLGAGSEVVATGSRSEVAAVAQRLVEQAQRSLLLHTESLSTGIHDRPDFLEAAIFPPA